ncbi:MAG: HlyD family type I secretion periplasmic adaptor subunit [Rhodoferax sp.]
MAQIQRLVFQAVGWVSTRVAQWGSPLFGHWLNKFFPPPPENLDWAGDADWARLQQEPVRARFFMQVMGVTLILLVIWAGVAEVDEVTRGEAKVVPSRQVQVIQSFDGGVVEAILVKEGDVVNQGDLLLRIDATRSASSMEEGVVNLAALRARAARLDALTRGVPFSPPPDLVKEAPQLIEAERRLYESRRSEIEAQVAQARSQLLQRQQELEEVTARRDQASRSLELATQELKANKPLLETGAASQMDILRLEREVVRLRGERDQAVAQIGRVKEAIRESTKKIQEVELTPRNQMRNELADVMGKIAAMQKGQVALADKVRLSEIRSPVKGTVKRLLVNTVGGVVLPGRDVLEIVPLDDALIVEARIRPQDIAFLRVGQDAVVKITAYDFAVYGGLPGVVEQIGADSITDEKGMPFYLVRVRTTKNSLGANMPIMPGMVAQVDILTGKKTVLSYLFKRVLKAKANALTEK